MDSDLPFVAFTHRAFTALFAKQVNSLKTFDKAFTLFFTVALISGTASILKRLTKITATLTKRIAKPLIQPSDRMFKKYGRPGSWAVITGGSGRVGVAMAQNLAAQGFNICIIGRDKEEDLESALAKLKQGRPDLATKAVSADFSGMHQIQDYNPIAEELSQLDIGILILGAGVGVIGSFAEASNQEIVDTVNVNALHVVYLAKLMAPFLVKRSQDQLRSAMIIVSAPSAAQPSPGLLAYSCTKSFVSFVGEALSYELKSSGVDVISYQGGEVSSLLRPHQAYPDRAAQAVFRDIGSTPVTQGTLRNSFVRWKSSFLLPMGPSLWARQEQRRRNELKKQGQLKGPTYVGRREALRGYLSTRWGQ